MKKTFRRTQPEHFPLRYRSVSAVGADCESGVSAPEQTACATRRGAILSMELVLVLPIFLMLILSIVEFSMLMSAKIRVSDAARQGARMLSIGGQNEEQIRSRIIAMLGPAMGGQCQVQLQPAANVGELGNVYVRVPMRSATPDLLWMTGFSVRNRFLDADAPMVMERRAASNQISRF